MIDHLSFAQDMDSPIKAIKRAYECPKCSWKGKYHQLNTVGVITMTGSVIVLRCPNCHWVLGAE